MKTALLRRDADGAAALAARCNDHTLRFGLALTETDALRLADKTQVRHAVIADPQRLQVYVAALLHEVRMCAGGRRAAHLE